MPANTIDQSFVKQFESEVHLVFQRMGAKLLNTVRRKTNITGQSTTFQKIGKGVAGTKSRNGDVPILNLDHEPIEVTLADYYAGEYIDRLDTLKVNHDDRSATARAIAYAMGRQADQLIIDAIDDTANDTVDAGGVTLAKVETVYEALGNNDVPDDGNRYFWTSPQGWTDLMNLSQFANADYVPDSELPFRAGAGTFKGWFSFRVAVHSGLTKAAAIRQSLVYHRDAVGAASGAEVGSDITWQGEKQAWLIVGFLSQGAKIIDDSGVYRLDHTES